jgi:hypothetical protein
MLDHAWGDVDGGDFGTSLRHFPSEVPVAATYIEKPQAPHVPAQFDLGRAKELVTVIVMARGLSLGVLISKLIPGNTD